MVANVKFLLWDVVKGSFFYPPLTNPSFIFSQLSVKY